MTFNYLQTYNQHYLDFCRFSIQTRHQFHQHVLCVNKSFLMRSVNPHPATIRIEEALAAAGQWLTQADGQRLMRTSGQRLVQTGGRWWRLVLADEQRRLADAAPCWPGTSRWTRWWRTRSCRARRLTRSFAPPLWTLPRTDWWTALW